MSGEETAPAAARAPFAPGEFLTRFPPGAPHALRLDSRREKPGWQARLPGGLVEAAFAGTAVLFEGRYYEVTSAREVGGWVSYYLDPWDEALVLRRIVELSPQASARESRALVVERRERAAATSLALLMPVVGLLPAALQERIEKRYGLPASRSTAWSAAVLLAVSSALFVLGLAAGFAGAAGVEGAAPPRASTLARYFMLESLFRLGGALAAAEANGTLPIVAAFWLWRLLRRERAAAVSPPPPAAAPADSLAESDEVRRVEGDAPRLEIASLLPKPHWTKAVGIRHQAAWYRLAETAVEPRGEGSLYRFTLVADPDAFALRGACEYDPREIVALLRQAAVARHATWVETLAPVWGLLGETEQRRLAEIYDYPPERSTGWSILATAIAGGLAAIPAVLYLVTGAGTAPDVAMLLGGSLLLADAVRRLPAFQRGELRASWLAPLARPFCRRFLSASSPAAAR